MEEFEREQRMMGNGIENEVEDEDDPFILDKEKVIRLEQLNEEILTLRYQHKSFENRRNLNRLAISKLIDLQKEATSKPIIQNNNKGGKQDKQQTTKEESQPTMWMNFSDIFIKFPLDTAKDIIQSDQSQLEFELNETGEKLNDKSKELQSLQQLKS